MESKPATPELRKPEDWAPEFDRVVADPDGWRCGVPGYPGAKSWEEPITRDEYEARLTMCTTRPR